MTLQRLGTMTIFHLFTFFMVNNLLETQNQCSHLNQSSIGFDQFILPDSAQTVQICIHHRQFGRSRQCLLDCSVQNFHFRNQLNKRCQDSIIFAHHDLGGNHLQKQLQRIHKAGWSCLKKPQILIIRITSNAFTVNYLGHWLEDGITSQSLSESYSGLDT